MAISGHPSRAALPLLLRDVCPGMSPRSSSLAEEDALAGAMQAAQAGDRDAYRRLMQACVPIVIGMVRARGIRGAAVDDVVQDVLLTVHRVRATYDPGRPFLPWLRAIAQRRAIDALRHGGRRPQEVSDPVAYEGRADDGPGPDHAVTSRQRTADLAAAVARLPEGPRQAGEHLALRELSLAEASTLTGRSTGALKVNLHRALKALRAALSPD